MNQVSIYSLNQREGSFNKGLLNSFTAARNRLVPREELRGGLTPSNLKLKSVADETMLL